MSMIDYAAKASIGLIKNIPGGTFRMGSRFHPREQPARAVFVAAFQITHAPVTVSQYSVFIESGAAAEKRWWSAAGWEWLNGRSNGWGRSGSLKRRMSIRLPARHLSIPLKSRNQQTRSQNNDNPRE